MAKVYYTAHKVLSLLGAFATRKDQLFKLEELGDMFPTPQEKAEFEALPASAGVIVVSQLLKRSLRPEHLAAIVAHEQAHIDCGHIHCTDEAGANGVVDNLGYEIQADLGAASTVGAKTVRKALIATCVAIVDVLVVDMGLGEDQRRIVNRKVYNSIKPRMAALRAYK